MADGIDFKDAAGNALKQLKDKLGPAPEQPQWSIWGAQQQRPNQQGPVSDQPIQGRRMGDAPAGPLPPVSVVPDAVPQMRPEQMPGTERADDRTKNLVFQDINQAQSQTYRQQAGRLYLSAIERANQSKDPTLQAMSKVEYGLANMTWGFTQDGFKWILEAGSNNPSIYDNKTNQSFLKRLAQAGMPSGAVDMLLQKGAQDPFWYLKDNDAAKKLDSAMTGPIFVAPADGGQVQQRQNTDYLLPPKGRPDQVNPQLDPPPRPGSNTWMSQQVKVALDNAAQEKNWQNAFGVYKQAVDMADRSRDTSLQAYTRVETGLALMKWGNVEIGYKWILDAGVKNPSIYDSRSNKGFVDRLAGAGIPKPAIDMLITNGQKDPKWGVTDPDAAKRLESVTRNPQSTQPAPYAPRDDRRTPDYRPTIAPPAPISIPGYDKPTILPPKPNDPPKKNPFAR